MCVMNKEGKYQSAHQSIVLMGKTGSGKGTQAEMLAAALGYKIFSTGQKTREVSAEDSPLGKQIQKIGVSGWIPEWLATYFMVEALLKDYANEGLVFESVARKPQEARHLNEIHEMTNRSYIVIFLEIADEVVIERMRARKRDASDSEENIQKRLRAYEEETTESVAFFKEKNKLVNVNADQAPDKVFEDILSEISK